MADQGPRADGAATDGDARDASAPRRAGDLSEELAGELGVLLVRMERALRGIGEIGRVHICRWGDGSEHLHWWLIARPARMHQLSGSFATIWDDVLPPLPETLWRENVAAFARGLE